MAMLSNKAKYALKALRFLATEQGKGPILISNIAKHEEIPRKFLEQILLELRKEGVLYSKIGKGGGYILLKNPKEITLFKVIRIIDGPLAPTPCASVTAYHACNECKDVETCEIRVIMREVRDATVKILENKTVADLVNMSIFLEKKSKKKEVVK
jgi:Rrf2 family protein